MGWLKKKFPPGLKTRKKRLGQQHTNQHETETLISDSSHQQSIAQRKLVEFSGDTNSAADGACWRFTANNKRLPFVVASSPPSAPSGKAIVVQRHLPSRRVAWSTHFVPFKISDSEGDSIRSRQFLLSGGTLLMERSCTIEELQFRQLEEQVWLLMWLVLEPKRLQYLVQKYGNERMSRRWADGRWGSWLVWRALLVSCSAEGAKSASPVPLAENHVCDMPCLKDHVSRLLEICAPTRDYWRMFGWSGLSVEAVLQKIINEDIMPMVGSVQSIPIELEASLKRLEEYQKELRKEREANLGSVEADRQKGNPTCGIIPKKRGRPAKASTLKNKESGRMDRVFLWKFLLELLENQSMHNCLRWVSREEGIFRIINTDLLARMWGRRHGNPCMTYEKLARAMRTYYRSGTFLMVPRCRNLPRKLVYRFAPSTLRRFWQGQMPKQGSNSPLSPLSDPVSSTSIENNMVAPVAIFTVEAF